MKRALVDSDSDSELKLSINNDYAKRYNTWREKEELQKLKDRYGTDKIDDGSSSSEDEDENPEEIKNIFEKDFFKTLSYLKKQDPCIYDSNVKFFNEKSKIESENQALPVSNKKEKKPLTIRDYERKIITERSGILSDDEEDHTLKKKKLRPSSPTIVEEQRVIKESFKDVLKSDDEDDSGDWGGLFKQRTKTEEESKKENDEYLEWLKGQKDDLVDKNVESDLKHLHDYWNDPKLDSGEAFLKDYVLNKRYLERDDKDLPTYNEIIEDSDENLSEDENTLQQQEEFEHKYNFRFEEPDKDFIKRYPRTMENSMRRKDDRRKRKREEIRERKEAEKAVKREEIKQLKALKRKEIMERIEKLKQVTGNDELGFKDEDLEEDFNPEEYDKRMSQIFNEEFYGGEEGDQKPEFPDLDEELEIERWDKWQGQPNSSANGGDETYEPHCEDPDFNMDCDYNPKESFQMELIESTKKRKKHRQSKFAELVAKPKPVFDPNDHTFEEYVDEYYKLDFEDIIGDLPCRFKYRKVVPNDFGLTIDEILRADDRELNRWCSLKKAVQYRPDEVEKYDVQAYRQKARNEALKRKILPSLYVNEREETHPDLTPPKETETNNVTHKKKKKKKKRNSESIGETSVGEASDVTVLTTEKVNGDGSMPTKMKKKKKKEQNKSHTEQMSETKGDNSHVAQIQNNPIRKKHKQKNKPTDQDTGISDARLKAYGINPKKFKNKLKYANKKDLGKR